MSLSSSALEAMWSSQHEVSAVKWKARLTEDGDECMPAFDYTRLTAILTCPTWGIVRYGLHKTFNTAARSMPLEAGEAMHEFFAAVRLCDLYLGVDGESLLRDGIIEREATRLFGRERWDAHSGLLLNSREDTRTRVLQFGLAILGSTGFYDDPTDNRRTLTKLEECAIAYVDRWDKRRGNMPVYVSPDADIVGIEVPFDIVVEGYDERGQLAGNVRYVGKMDGLHYDSENGAVIVHENKTSSRINEAWSAGMLMSHQVTGYVIAAHLMTNLPCNKAYVHGLQIPLPTYSSHDTGVVRDVVHRDLHQFNSWVKWLIHAITVNDEHIGKPYHAPRFTHSCNRYFRPCPFIPLCDSRDEEEFNSTLLEMDIDRWSPLDD